MSTTIAPPESALLRKLADLAQRHDELQHSLSDPATLANPARIVIDLTGVRWAGGSLMTKPAAGLVEHIRVGEPQAGTVRIVLDMKSPVGYRISRNGSVIVITIGERAIAATAASE